MCIVEVAWQRHYALDNVLVMVASALMADTESYGHHGDTESYGHNGVLSELNPKHGEGEKCLVVSQSRG